MWWKLERYRDLGTMRFQNIVDVHVAVTLGISHSLYMVRETNKKIGHLTTWQHLR
jgi:hypothetical protein